MHAKWAPNASLMAQCAARPALKLFVRQAKALARDSPSSPRRRLRNRLASVRAEAAAHAAPPGASIGLLRAPDAPDGRAARGPPAAELTGAKMATGPTDGK